ncbi:MAG: hypothetical protein NTU97_03035 [Candidatus Magasanikbacteria bacterium]|nr:hypothetical protein [Candidatus Magasanikbacteria bacterium]
MKTKWLDFVLLLTNRIYTRKQKVLSEVGLKTVANIIVLIGLEIFLALVSLPLYLTTKSGGVVAYLEEKGGYAKVSFDYNLRRILTLTGVGIFLIIWLMKLLLIVLAPHLFGPMRLYQVSDLRPADLLSKETVQTETGIQTARVSPAMLVPSLEGVNKIGGGNYEFYGKAVPNSTVVLLLSDTQSVIYTEVANVEGVWKITHPQTNFKLSPGNHSILVFSYDAAKGIRSEVAPTQYFKVQINWLESLSQKIDVLANWSVVLIIILGIFLTFLTI